MTAIPTLAEIDLAIFDFDGVMTDNRVYVFEDGREAVLCNRADGQGCTMLSGAGLDMMILSTETNSVVAARAAKLGLRVQHGEKDKGRAVSTIVSDLKLDPVRILYVGNDVNDLDAMRGVGWPVAPADAHPDILAVARFVTSAPGGGGVVRELADILLASK